MLFGLPSPSGLVKGMVASSYAKVVNIPGNATQLMVAGALVVQKCAPDVLVQSLMTMSHTITKTILKDAKNVFTIQEAVQSNKLTAATIQFLWNERHTVTRFMIDVIECAKCYVKADSTTWDRDYYDEHGQDNELDMTDQMNQHALLCQAQRLVKSIAYILTHVGKPLAFKDIDMSTATQLDTDPDNMGSIIEVTPSGYQKISATSDASVREERRDSAVADSKEMTNGHNKKATNGDSKKALNGHQEPASRFSTPGYWGGENPARVTDEKWFFVNGIGTELYWLHLACRKLAKRYSRNVTGIYNRGDGILWDLIECAGQRNIKEELSGQSQKNIVHTTKSGQAAQDQLADQLEAALLDASAYKQVVIIAHSQGCLVLRLALESVRAKRSAPLIEAIRERLCVFTFGNPSVDWIGERDDTLRTEHFVNDTDFVAKLGVCHNKDSKKRGYRNLFINKEEGWNGHLFGAQYSLHRKHYTDEFGKKKSQKSWLLNCREGESINVSRKRMLS